MLIAKNITKKFSGVTALDNINLELYPGKVNAIIGENGAGKSTLMKIFSGVYAGYDGDIIYKNKTVRFSNIKEAEASGIAIIHQELNLIPDLNITENIFLGKEIINAWGVMNKTKMQEKVQQLLGKLKLTIKPDARVSSLRTGQQQLIEIAKALLLNAEVIIMDEPTSAISDKEVETLFTIINELKAEGKTIVYISHKLKELFQIADRYIVIRDGRTIDAGNMKETTPDSIIQKMVGRKIESAGNSTTISLKDELLRVQGITLTGSASLNRKTLKDISFSLHKGEILGIYGLMGSGRSELVETIFGLHPGRSSGQLYVNGKLQTIHTPAQAIKAGVALVPEDRKTQGLIINQDIKTNITITILQQLQRWGLIINTVKELQLVKKLIDQLSIKTSSVKNKAGNLSGGNQQKIVLAKWLATNPKVLLLDEPTRGIDINAKYEIYKLMKTLAGQGMGIIMISSELPEILSVSDRVLVIAEGELTANIPVQEANENNILKWAIQKN